MRRLFRSGGVCNLTGIAYYFQNKQLCLTHLAVLHSIAGHLDEGGGSRVLILAVDPEESNPSQIGGAYRPENEGLQRILLTAIKMANT